MGRPPAFPPVVAGDRSRGIVDAHSVAAGPPPESRSTPCPGRSRDRRDRRRLFFHQAPRSPPSLLPPPKHLLLLPPLNAPLPSHPLPHTSPHSKTRHLTSRARKQAVVPLQPT